MLTKSISFFVVETLIHRRSGKLLFFDFIKISVNYQQMINYANSVLILKSMLSPFHFEKYTYIIIISIITYQPILKKCKL